MYARVSTYDARSVVVIPVRGNPGDPPELDPAYAEMTFLLYLHA